MVHWHRGWASLILHHGVRVVLDHVVKVGVGSSRGAARKLSVSAGVTLNAHRSQGMLDEAAHVGQLVQHLRPRALLELIVQGDPLVQLDEVVGRLEHVIGRLLDEMPRQRRPGHVGHRRPRPQVGGTRRRPRGARLAAVPNGQGLKGLGDDLAADNPGRGFHLCPRLEGEALDAVAVHDAAAPGMNIFGTHPDHVLAAGGLDNATPNAAHGSTPDGAADAGPAQVLLRLDNHVGQVGGRPPVVAVAAPTASIVASLGPLHVLFRAGVVVRDPPEVHRRLGLVDGAPPPRRVHVGRDHGGRRGRPRFLPGRRRGRAHVARHVFGRRSLGSWMQDLILGPLRGVSFA